MFRVVGGGIESRPLRFLADIDLRFFYNMTAYRSTFNFLEISLTPSSAPKSVYIFIRVSTCEGIGVDDIITNFQNLKQNSHKIMTIFVTRQPTFWGVGETLCAHCTPNFL